MDLGLQGRVALLVGASKNIGAAAAEAFAREGTRLALVARQEAPLRAVADKVSRESAAEVLPLPADVTRPADIGWVVGET